MTRQHKYLKSFSSALWDTQLISSRITLAMGELFWAIMLLWPGDTFGRPAYSHMAAAMSEEMWGIIFLVSGVTQLTIVILDDMHSTFARYFAAWNATLWCYTVYSMLASMYPPPAAIGGEIALAIAAAWIFIRPYILARGYCSAYGTR